VSNIYLVGFMGAGKTATGRLVADRLGRVFVDLDEAIEAREGRSIREIFTHRGESAFRDAETAELEAMTLRTDLVVATGGGAYSSPTNRRMIRRSGGVSVFLDPPWEAICERLGGGHGGRPKWIDERHARTLYLQRRSDYLLAEIRIEPGDGESAAEVADRVSVALAEATCAS
jgi:shikimate kinase